MKEGFSLFLSINTLMLLTFLHRTTFIVSLSLVSLYAVLSDSCRIMVMRTPKYTIRVADDNLILILMSRSLLRLALALYVAFSVGSCVVMRKVELYVKLNVEYSIIM